MKPVIVSSAVSSLLLITSPCYGQTGQSSSNFNPLVENYTPPARQQRYIPVQNRLAAQVATQRPPQTIPYYPQQASAATQQSPFEQPTQMTASTPRALAPQAYPQSTSQSSYDPLSVNNDQMTSMGNSPIASQAPIKPWYAGLRLFASTLSDLDGSERVSPTTIDNGQVTFDAGYGLGLLGGYRLNKHFRVEGEISYQDYEVDSARITRITNGTVASQTPLSNDDLGFQAWTVMANGYFDLPIANYPQFIPYIGAGLGGMFQRNGAEEDSFAYQVMVGMNYSFNNDDTVAGIGYRYITAPDILDSDLLHFDAQTNAIELTVRQNF
jgi:opacity protein-like surface antigen